jgi:Mg2+-importing ATPase
MPDEGVSERAAPREASSAAAAGLTSAEARRLARRHGPNELAARRARSVLRDFARRFRNPLIAILIAASAVSAFTGDVASFVMVTLVVLLSVAIDFVQEHRAGRAAEALIRRVQVHASVLRDGRYVSLPVSRLVPGDVAALAAGSVIPGDGRLLEANGLHLDEALLTGEPFPVERRPSRAHDAVDLFMGTSVVSGTATMRIARTGAATEMGKIAASLRAEPPPTEFERGLRAFGMLIMRLTAFMVLFVLLVNAALHRPLLESFLFAVALAVGLTPELLPMILSVTLSRGALRLASEHVIVKRLPAIEGLGSMDVLCTDKTGTLTQARIRLERAVDLDGRECEAARAMGALNSLFQAGIRTPLDEALAAHAPPDAREWTRLAEVPFDFERRRVAVLLARGARRVLVVKGAPEEMLRHCTQYAAADGTVHAWGEAAHQRATTQLHALGTAGLRVLAIAHREHESDHASARDEHGLVLDGFAAFADPPKAGAAAALAALSASGVAVKVLTGDGPEVTRHLCDALGLEVKGVLTGTEIAHMDDRALAARAQATTLFCRVNPAQKVRIVAALRARGHVVGFLGDGINDAPALHRADVGLSVNNAVDVAREAAALILLKRDLGVLHRGVIEGRRTFVNIRKYVLMGTSSNFGNMFSMAAASTFLPFLPLLPAQILLNNLLYDVSEIPIPLDRADASETARPQKWDMRLIRNFMWALGPVSSLFDFLTFYVLLALFQAHEALFRTGWFVESLATQVLVIFVIRTRASPFASRPHPALAAIAITVVAIAVALPFTPLAAPLGFVAPPPAFLAVLALLVAAYLALAQLVKRAFYKLSRV